MANKTTIKSRFTKIQLELRNFIELSLKEDELSWSDWISSISSKINIKCWEEKKCGYKQCPAYLSECGRCWIIAGTMCGGEVHGKFAKKYDTCKDCEIYRKVVYADPAREIEEHLIVLVHSLRCKQEEIKEIAIKDHLTGLFNRRHFDSYIQHEYNKMKRRNSSLVIMMIDVNNFKQINDIYGHAKGDYILKECANIFQNTIRESDIAFRVGGDEFIIVMHECCDNKSYAESLVSRIDSKIDQLSENNAIGFQLSLSYGFSILTKSVSNIQCCLDEADVKMYEDKRNKKSTQSSKDGLFCCETTK
ncbi:MAG: GGDEF domain-containing protein [Desulfobulbaceae bacterium]|nr:GGDEF domain-containing protein [Desulfobulbaceae bacterium]